MPDWLALLKQYIGWQGATSLADKLTAARAALLDQITALRMAELDPAGLPADVAAVLADTAAILVDTTAIDALTAATLDAAVSTRALEDGGRLANVEGAVGAIEGLTDLHNKLTAARALLLDQITALRMAELDPAGLPADVAAVAAQLVAVLADTAAILVDTTAIDALTAATLDAAVSTRALEDGGRLANVEGAVGAIEGLTDLHNKLTAARALLLDQITALRMAELDPAGLPADVAAVAAQLVAVLADTAAIIGAIAALNDLAQADILTDATPFAGANVALIKTQTDKLGDFQHEIEWSATPVVEQVANAAAVNLTAGSITPAFPTGATRVRAILVASIHVANQAANTHHIDLKVQGQKTVPGGYVDLLDLTAQTTLGLVNLDGAADGWCGAIDVTALVDTSAVQYDFRFVVDSDDAGAVNYTTGFTLALIYRI